MARPKKEQAPIEPVRMIEIKSGRKRMKFKAWQYYSILDTLRFLNIDLTSATEIAKWAARSKEPGEKQVNDINIKLYEEKENAT